MKNKSLQLYAPEFALKKLTKYALLIVKKTKMSKQKFEKQLFKFSIYVNFVSLEKYQDAFNQIKLLTKTFTEKESIELLNDIDFLALALKLNCPLWSNDKLLKKQTKIEVLTKSDLITKLKVNIS
ncbi:MAG: PIN domain-containing protein [archaeon]